MKTQWVALMIVGFMAGLPLLSDEPRVLPVTQRFDPNLGTVDAGSPILLELPIANFSDKERKVYVPATNPAARVISRGEGAVTWTKGTSGRLERGFHPAKQPEATQALSHDRQDCETVTLPPGEAKTFVFEYDPSGEDGKVQIPVLLYTDDPGARKGQIRVEFSATLERRTSVVPAYSCLGRPWLEPAKAEAVRFVFTPLIKGEKFVSARVEDPSAPVQIETVFEPSGRLVCTVRFDLSKPIPRKNSNANAVRIIGMTDGDHTQPFLLQWAVKEGEADSSK